MKIVIGTANFLRKYSFKKESVSKNEVLRILNFAKLNKINSIDTAYEYDKFYTLQKKINFNNFLISTKIVFTKKILNKKNLNEYIINSIQKKLGLFKIKKFESLFIHNFDQLNQKELKILEPLFLTLKKKKLIKNIGISVYDTNKLIKIKNFDFINLIQAPINLFDRRFTSNKIIYFLKKKKIKLQARSIFLQGKLLNSFKKNFHKKNKIYKDYNSWLIKKNRQPLKTCLDYIKSKPCINSIVIGVGNTNELIEIINLIKNKKKIYFPHKIQTLDKKIIDPRRW
jgi:aryl-alcohol dehydrogenase-like predicted oxidoreductase